MPVSRRSSQFGCQIALVAALAGPDLWAKNPAATITKDQCVDFNAQAQSLRRQGRFAEARDKLLACSDAACPQIVREDCIERRDELDRAQPTIVLDIEDESGNARSDATVVLDSQKLPQPPGTVPVDPGEHTLVVTAPGAARFAGTVVLKEGQKERHETVLLAREAPATEATQPPASEHDASGSPHRASGLGLRTALGIAAEGLALAGVVTGAGLGLGASSALNDQKRNCGSPTQCPNHALALSDHSTVVTDSTWSTVGFVAGGAFLVAGTWLLLTGGPTAPPGAAPVAITPDLGTGTTGVLVRGRF
jgi:hypothetical protein